MIHPTHLSRSLLLTGMGLLIIAAPESPAQSVLAGPLATLGEKEVSEDELQPFFRQLGAEERDALAADPTTLNQWVRGVLLQRVILQEAQALGHDNDPEVREQMKRVMDAVLVESYLQSVSTPPDGYPSAEELAAAYLANREALTLPRQVRLAQIFIPVPPVEQGMAMEDARARVARISQTVNEAGANFATIADTHGSGPMASPGGELGWVSEAQLRPGIREVVGGLEVGETAGPIRLEDGWHFVHCLDEQVAEVLPLEEVRVRLVAAMRSELSQQMRQRYLADLLRQNPVSINEVALGKLLSESP